MKVFILGAGHVGTALSIAFKRIGFGVFIASRTLESAKRAAALSHGKVCTLKDFRDADVIFLTVPDSEIVNAAKEVEEFVSKKQVVVHTSGALSSEILSFLDAHVASLHPLKSFADPIDSANSLSGVLFTFEGDGVAQLVLNRMVERLGGKFVRIQSKDKILYHLAAVLTANYTVSLFNISESILLDIGFSKEESKDMLLNLLGGVIDNIRTGGSVFALTGPIERGDSLTVKKHLDAIKDPMVKNIYIFLGFATLNIAKQKGLSKEKFDDIRKVLNEQNNCS